MLWWSLALTLAGSIFTLGATALIARAAFADRRRWKQKINEAKRIQGHQIIALRRLRELQEWTVPSDPRVDHQSLPVPLAPDERSRAAIDEKYDALLRSVLGREVSDWALADLPFLPEHMALAITNDQIRELRLPAGLVALGVIVSTVGSILSLWA